MHWSLMSRYLTQVREGHLNQDFHLFGYLKSRQRSNLAFNDSMSFVNDSLFSTDCDWIEFYPDAKEILPLDMPQSQGNPVVMRCFVDADHVGCNATRRSHTGIIIFYKLHISNPIMVLKEVNYTVETSTFGSEIVVL